MRAPCKCDEDLCVDILEQDISNLGHGLLNRLLKDRTTGKNIIWATDEYIERGKRYAAECEIKPAQIIGKNTTIIQPRVKKSREAQQNRTRNKAEVFTPSWLCNEMNNHCDAQWFGRENVFNTTSGRDWIPNNAPIVFDDSKKPWQKYVDLRCLEITCGEGPYLASRYDTTTGEYLPVERRIGILDRKLRIVSENTDAEPDWWKWAVRAFQSTYGYEYQGDNLLLARENLLWTFMDYYECQFGHVAPISYLNKIADIISWNLWQMNGLTDYTPCGVSPDMGNQLTLFDCRLPPECDEIKPCQIKDWRKKTTHLFKDLKGDAKMKFDFCIGNPPYQEEADSNSTTNGQKPRRSIFQYLQQAVDQTCSICSVLIYPAARWIHRSGKGMAQFGLEQINDKTLHKLIVYPDATDVFPTIEISDGISIVIKKPQKNSNTFEYVYREKGKEFQISLKSPGEDLLPIDPRATKVVNKIKKFADNNELPFLHASILPRTLFGIESDFVEKNPDKVRVRAPDAEIDLNTEVKLLTNDRAGKAGRATWFIANIASIPNNHNLIREWQVVVSSASPGGIKRDNQLEIIDNHSAFGRARVALKSFQTKQEAQNFYNYVSSQFIKFAFLLTDENLTSVGKLVPDVLDYTNKNTLLDFDKDVDQQLFKLIGLTKDEIEYVKEKIDTLR